MSMLFKTFIAQCVYVYTKFWPHTGGMASGERTDGRWMYSFNM